MMARGVPVNYVNIDATFEVLPGVRGRPLSHHQSLREALRAATRAEHKALEAQPLMQRLLSPELTLIEYGQILRAQRAYYRALEPALMPLEQQLRERFPEVGYRYQSRLASLDQDCRVLQLPDDHDIRTGASWRPPLDSTEEALGVLYVLEGASQGGRVIARALNRSLGLESSNGADFFHYHVTQDGWTRLCLWLESIPLDATWHCALTGAKATFTGLKAHFDHWQRQLSDR
ncbi:MAG: hypothetical protein CMG77_14480 [Marinimicrobium sp.]|nr:hypothetical protein [Marinimicrobium sp.]